MRNRHGNEIKVEPFISENTDDVVVTSGGAGMSFANMEHIKQSIESGRSAIVVDGKGDLTSHRVIMGNTKDGMSSNK
ncbi:MAG: hypothetical protein KKA19_06265 [Candidatus Margulisbacteria bacterium]|nr:hypothetical protein [Candidatus Margulisiibacteriota bacterium]